MGPLDFTSSFLTASALGIGMSILYIDTQSLKGDTPPNPPPTGDSGAVGSEGAAIGFDGDGKPVHLQLDLQVLQYQVRQ